MQCRSLLVTFSLAMMLTACRDRAPREYAQPTLEMQQHARDVAPMPAVEPTAAAPATCPVGMTMIEGEHCPVVEHKCLRWLDPPGKWQFFRCAEYSKEVTCKVARVHKRYCIDTDEAGATPSDPRPANHVSFTMAKNACETRGARLCSESEFEFACEGEAMQPYPYGFKRDAAACNVDREDVVTPNKKAIYDLRRKVGEDAACVSPFGVRNLAGNVEEWTTRDRPGLHSKPTLLKGSWWLKGKHTCRATNGGHDDWYQGTETGYRCCSSL